MARYRVMVPEGVYSAYVVDADSPEQAVRRLAEYILQNDWPEPTYEANLSEAYAEPEERWFATLEPDDEEVEPAIPPEVTP